LRLKAIVIIPRIDGVFRLREAIVHRDWGFNGFKVDSVKAYYRSNNPIDGYGVALILEQSPADEDFGVPIWFPSEYQIRAVREAMDRSDELTEKLLGRGWLGVRPYLKLHHFC